MQKSDTGTAPNRTASERLTLYALASNPNSSLSDLERITGTATQLCVRVLRFAGLIVVSEHAAHPRDNRYSLAPPPGA